jgi:hypothetical protein
MLHSRKAAVEATRTVDPWLRSCSRSSAALASSSLHHEHENSRLSASPSSLAAAVPSLVDASFGHLLAVLALGDVALGAS